MWSEVAKKTETMFGKYLSEEVFLILPVEEEGLIPVLRPNTRGRARRIAVTSGELSSRAAAELKLTASEFAKSK